MVYGLAAAGKDLLCFWTWRFSLSAGSGRGHFQSAPHCGEETVSQHQPSTFSYPICETVELSRLIRKFWQNNPLPSSPLYFTLNK